MRVLVLATYPLGRLPSQRFRWEQYISPLERRGISLEPSCFFRPEDLDHYVRFRGQRTRMLINGALRRLRNTLAARRYDLVLVHRESLPLGPAWVEAALTRLHVPYLFDFDDAIYLDTMRYANTRFAWLKGADRTAAAIRGARLVLAGNEHLAGWARRHTSRILIVPTTIDTRLYTPSAPRTGTSLCVGWSGSVSTIRYLDLIAPVLRELQQERGIKIRVIGSPDFEIPGAEIESLPWRLETELQDLRAIDIGIMPLPDDEWTKGKCGLKALQYMALGIPTIMSPVGVNPRIARNGAALLADTHAAWKDALCSLLDDPELRSRVGAAGRRRVEEEYSVEALLPTWEQALWSGARVA